MDKQTEKVDRSRLTLLLGLSSTAAAAGCSGTGRDRNKNPYQTFGSQQYPTDDTGKTGGEGEGGGGGSH